MSSHLSFIKNFLKNPVKTGSVWPSSSRLAQEMIAGITLRDALCVAEIGPGTGAITRIIISNIGKNTKFFAVELNKNFYSHFKKEFPDTTIYNNSILNLNTILKQEGVSALDCIISSLPWASFSLELQNTILNSILTALNPGGYFVTFAYLQGLLLPNARAFRKNLDNLFSNIITSKIIWKNIPPALVYKCKK